MDRTNPSECSDKLPNNMRERSLKVLDHEDPNDRAFRLVRCTLVFVFIIIDVVPRARMLDLNLTAAPRVR
jgi:hypothetical protein